MISAAPTQTPARPESRWGIRHLGTLLGLAWMLRVRGYTRNWKAALGFAFTLLFFILPVAAGAALLTGLGYVALPRPVATQLLFGALLVLYIAWAALPLLQYTVNEGLDVTKLQIYPVTRTEQMLTLVLSTLFDLSGLVILGVFAGVVIGWHATPLALAVTLVALVFAYVHTVTLSQLLLAALMGMLRSRRYRDLSIILFVLVSTTCSFAAQIVPRVIDFANPSALPSVQLDSYIWWTPPGMAAEAITQANAGNYVIGRRVAGGAARARPDPALRLGARARPRHHDGGDGRRGWWASQPSPGDNECRGRSGRWRGATARLPVQPRRPARVAA